MSGLNLLDALPVSLFSGERHCIVCFTLGASLTHIDRADYQNTSTCVHVRLRPVYQEIGGDGICLDIRAYNFGLWSFLFGRGPGGVGPRGTRGLL